MQLCRGAASAGRRGSYGALTGPCHTNSRCYNVNRLTGQSQQRSSADWNVKPVMPLSFPAQLRSYLERPERHRAEDMAREGTRALPVLCDFLREDLPIDRTERVETVLKAVLFHLFRAPVSGRDARELARFQQRLGLILKYKSYAIKAAAPLGYSIFLQNRGEGFQLPASCRA